MRGVLLISTSLRLHHHHHHRHHHQQSFPRLVIPMLSSVNSLVTCFSSSPPLFPASRTPARTNHPPTCAAAPSHPQTTRRAFLRNLSLTLSTIALCPALPSFAADKLSKLESAVVPVLMCRTIMTPVARYIEEGSWDKGRTNVNYCTRVLALRSRMREAAEQLQGDSFYEGMDIMGEMTNTMTQLDASLYTPLFIASDEGVSVEQQKYQTQARGYYGDAVAYLERFLSMVPAESLERARKVADKAPYEIKMEKE